MKTSSSPSSSKSRDLLLLPGFSTEQVLYRLMILACTSTVCSASKLTAGTTALNLEIQLLRLVPYVRILPVLHTTGGQCSDLLTAEKRQGPHQGTNSALIG